MRITPPVIWAPLRQRSPKMLPIFTPAALSRKVTTPMKQTAGTMRTRRKPKVTPTARASMLVARAMGSMTFQAREPSSPLSSFFQASRSMLAPMPASSTKAIQWSTLTMYFSKREPRKKPIRGMIA